MNNTGSTIGFLLVPVLFPACALAASSAVEEDGGVGMGRAGGRENSPRNKDPAYLSNKQHRLGSRVAHRS